jgi:1-acyl-sn-glycerol-3-phosphate acyltransferase
VRDVTARRGFENGAGHGQTAFLSEEKPTLTFPIHVFTGMVLPLIIVLAGTVVVATTVIIITRFTLGRVAQRLTVKWARIVLRLVGISCSVENAHNIVTDASYIITPNHQSIMDFLPLLCTLPMRFRWALKKKLLSIPLFGRGLISMGAVSIDRSNPGKALKVILNATERLKDGWSVLIYPEGTTTHDGQMLPFKRGPFLLAVKTGAPILPVTCNGAFKIMPRGSRLIKPGHVKVVIGKPIMTTGLNEKDVPALMEKTRAEMRKHLDPEYNPFKERFSPNVSDSVAYQKQ